ncbi:hypothetical protein [Bacteroides ovatus]|uniref:hypothetical protein n=1 Tax=Bacteroides ovatus TaxID=28116 RepID=UPI0021665F12|nr:hypothetical protein [Bacteroides ovatus]MCS3242891.1 hypothetical protein [Bacteroides ovatus]
MSDIQTSTIRVPKNVLEDIKIYCRKAGQPVGEWVERAWRFLQKNDFDIYDTEVTPSLPVPAEVERERNQVDDERIYKLAETGTTPCAGYTAKNDQQSSRIGAPYREIPRET